MRLRAEQAARADRPEPAIKFFFLFPSFFSLFLSLFFKRSKNKNLMSIYVKKTTKTLELKLIQIKRETFLIFFDWDVFFLLQIFLAEASFKRQGLGSNPPSPFLG